jgi:deazaflavin-dependent oxidoreductase (nitroreductase family)
VFNSSPLEQLRWEFPMSEWDRPERSIMPTGMPRFNKRFVNPLLVRLAPWVPSAAVVVHTGRRSGREYRTPVTAVRAGPSFAIPLPYGNRTDWSLNVRAAGGGKLIRAGQEYRIVNPRLAEAGELHRIPRSLRGLAKKVDILLVNLEPATTPG